MQPPSAPLNPEYVENLQHDNHTAIQMNGSGYELQTVVPHVHGIPIQGSHSQFSPIEGVQYATPHGMPTQGSLGSVPNHVSFSHLPTHNSFGSVPNHASYSNMPIQQSQTQIPRVENSGNPSTQQSQYYVPTHSQSVVQKTGVKVEVNQSKTPNSTGVAADDGMKVESDLLSAWNILTGGYCMFWCVVLVIIAIASVFPFSSPDSYPILSVAEILAASAIIMVSAMCIIFSGIHLLKPNPKFKFISNILLLVLMPVSFLFFVICIAAGHILGSGPLGAISFYVIICLYLACFGGVAAIGTLIHTCVAFTQYKSSRNESQKK